MSKLSDILQARGKYSAGVERGDTVLHGLTNKEAEQQVKQLMLDVFKSCEHDGSFVSIGAFEKKVAEL